VLEKARATYRTDPSRGSLAKTAISLYEAGHYEDALSLLDEGGASTSNHYVLVNLRGVVLRRLGRYDEALAAFREAAKLDRKIAGPHLNAGNVHLDRNDPAKAIEALTRASQREPRSAPAQKLLGRAYRMAGDLASARRRLELARQLAPSDPETWIELADVLALSGEVDQALELLDKGSGAIGENRGLSQARLVILRRAHRFAAALAWIDGLLQTQPNDAWLHFQRGRTLQRADLGAALDSLRRAVELAPEDPLMLTELADVLNRVRGKAEADNIAEAYELALRRLRLGGNLLRHGHGLFTVLRRCADYEAAKALGSFEELGRHWIATDDIAGLHMLIPRVETSADRRTLVELHRRWGRATDAIAARTPITRAPSIGGAKIRIGFMSSDLRQHPVAYFAAPLLQRLDRSRFEIFCYSWTPKPADAVQQRLASAVDKFVVEPRASDREAAQLIASDGLDVLFELGGSTDNNKLKTMAWRPTPRQASWLGYPHSAGLETIDRILTDPYIRPADPALLIERPLELPHSWVAFEQPGFGSLPGIEPDTPSARTGTVTFGTANNPLKYTPSVIAAWARVLAKVPRSRFLFVRPEGAVAPFRANIERQFARHGISADRIAFVPVRGAHLQHYNAIDISLDTFPQTGGTTTCESLYMGVPVVSLVGEAFFERLSYSNLSNAGLGELCVWNVDDYVAKSVELAADLAWRTDFRRTIGVRLRSHPLGQVDAFARDFEQAVTAWADEQVR